MKKGEITLEATIVTTTVMVLVIVLISMILYVHDALVIKAYAYGAANEAIEKEYEVFTGQVTEKVQQAPLFVLTPELKFQKNLDSYTITLQGRCTVKIFGFEQLFTQLYQPKSMTIERNMSTPILYLSRELVKQLERKKANGN